jgi:hypothetical protein
MALLAAAPNLDSEEGRGEGTEQWEVIRARCRQCGTVGWAAFLA